jgi:hypothetical protein
MIQLRSYAINYFERKPDYPILQIPTYIMKLNVIVLILIAGMFLAIIVIAQTTTPGTAKSDLNTSDNLTQTNTSQGTYVEGELLVRFEPAAFPTIHALEATSMKAHAEIGAVMINTFMDLPGLELVRLPPGMSVQEGKSYYQGISTVRYAEVNAVYSIANAPGKNSGIPSPAPTGNITSGDIFVKYNASAFPSSSALQVYANATNVAINATLVTDYTPFGMPGLQLVNLKDPMIKEQGIAFYRNVTNVLYTEPDVQYSAITPNMTVN